MKSADPIRIGVVDDHAVIAWGIAAQLSRHGDLELAAQAETVDALLKSGNEMDVVLLDLRLGDDSTPSRNIRKLHNAKAKVLVYSSGDYLSLVRDAARAGVEGFVRKSESLDVLIDAIRATMKGEVVTSLEWATAIETDTQLPPALLSDRERDVLSRYAVGETAETVAAALSLSPHTILDHIKRIRAKYAQLGRPAPTKSHLLQRAIEDGVVDSN